MLLLERLTGGACFEGVNDQAFLIHVLTNGVPIPEGLDPSLDLLLRGLLARDRRERWQWNEVRRWLAGETGGGPGRKECHAGAAGERRHHRLSGPDLPDSQPRSRLQQRKPPNWDEARDALLRGAVAAWAQEAGFDPMLQSGLRQSRPRASNSRKICAYRWH